MLGALASGGFNIAELNNEYDQACDLTSLLGTFSETNQDQNRVWLICPIVFDLDYLLCNIVTSATTIPAAIAPASKLL